MQRDTGGPVHELRSGRPPRQHTHHRYLAQAVDRACVVRALHAASPGSRSQAASRMCIQDLGIWLCYAGPANVVGNADHCRRVMSIRRLALRPETSLHGLRDTLLATFEAAESQRSTTWRLSSSVSMLR